MSDGPARLRPLRRPGRRLGLDGQRPTGRISTREHCAALHVNLVLGMPGDDEPEVLSEKEQAVMADIGAYLGDGSGYAKIQGTRPQTLAYGLTDSPAGQAAWIIEKFREWSDCDGDVETLVRTGSAPGQHHALLGHRDGRLVGPPLLREPALGHVRPRAAGRGAHRLCHLPPRDHPLTAALGRSAVQRGALHRAGARRALRGDGGPRRSSSTRCGRSSPKRPSGAAG